MNLGFQFFLSSIALGAALAMDAFSVSLANGLAESKMKFPRMCAVAGVYAVFQALMPFIGWICVHTILDTFKSLEKFIPWVALILLLFLGIKMIIEGIKCKDESCEMKKITFGLLMVQGVATSIDALSVGFAIPDYSLVEALICVAVIALITFIICMAGLAIGKKFGTFLAGKATIFGGAILCAIGIEIFVTSFF